MFGESSDWRQRSLLRVSCSVVLTRYSHGKCPVLLPKVTAISIVILAVPSGAFGTPPAVFTGLGPRYAANLDDREYALFVTAANHAIAKYGGDASLEAALRRSTNGAGTVEWQVTLRGERTIDAWAFWSAEQTTQFLSRVNLDKIDNDNKTTLKTLQSLNLKLEQAKNNPIWDLTVTPATVGVKETGKQRATADGGAVERSIFTLTAADETVEVVGPAAASLKELVGRRALVKGYVKAPGFVELVSVTPVKERTLELVIMSQCPFGIKAADAVIEHLKSPGHFADASTTPELCVRYLFYQREEPGTDGKPTTKWWSLHGDAEIEENLVQMATRDLRPTHFRDYLQRRSQQTSAKWQDIAALSMLPVADVDLITQHIAASRDAMIASEYAYVREILGVTDGSPTFVWESQVAKDIKRVPAFKSLDLNRGSCGGAAEHP